MITNKKDDIKIFNVRIGLNKEKMKFISYHELDYHDTPLSQFNETEIAILEELNNCGVIYFMVISNIRYPKYTGFGVQIKEILEGKYKVLRTTL